MPSSVIKAFAYDPQALLLTITFVSGRVYAYHDVPAEVGEGLRMAFAKGEYFNRTIRDRFAGVAVTPGTEPVQRPLL